MKKLITLFLILFTIQVNAQIPTGDISSNNDITRQSLIQADLGKVQGYLEYLPDGYQNDTTLHPLILFLHGKGERGNGNSELYKVAKHGLPNFIEDSISMCYAYQNQPYCFIALSPQLNNGNNSWGAGITNGFLDYAIANYRIDPNRIYVAGHSLGGIGTYKYAAHQSNSPNKLAAIAPVAANGVSSSNGCDIAGKNINIRHYHGDNDGIIGLPSGQASFNNITNCDTENSLGDEQFIILSNTGHNGAPKKAFDPNFIYDGANLYEWFLSHTLDENDTPTNQAPVAFAGTDLNRILPLDTILLNGLGTDEDGTIENYLWTQISGTTLNLSGAQTSQLSITNLSEGTYEFELKVTDNDGAMDSDSVSITIEAADLPVILTEKVTTKKGLRYLEYLPNNYDPNGNHPVLIYFPSDDAKGTDIDLVKNEGPFKYLLEGNNFCFNLDGEERCFIVIAPQVNTGEGIFRGKTNALYNDLLNEYGSDSSQIYLAGFDDGAAAIFARLLDPENNPNRYAGIATIGTRFPLNLNTEQIGLLNPKLVMAHSTDDEVFDFSAAQNFYDLINTTNNNSESIFINYNGTHIESMDQAFNPQNSQSIYEILFNEIITDPDTIPEPNVVITERITSKKDLKYLEYLPENYDENSTYPVLIYLPSDDAKGLDATLALNESPLNYINNGSSDFCFNINGVEECFIVIVPYVNEGEGYFRGKMNALYNDIVGRYSSDESKIYFAGFGEGAAAILPRLLDPENTPNRYAGIALVGLNVPSSIDPAQIGLIGTKVLFVHGANDVAAPYEYTESLNFYNDVRTTQNNTDTLFSTIPLADHQQSLDLAFDPASEYAVYEWLFGDHLLSRKTNNQSVVNKDFDISQKELINTLNTFNQNTQLLLINFSGQKMVSQPISNIENTLKTLPIGLYIYKLYNPNNHAILATGKIIKRE